MSAARVTLHCSIIAGRSSVRYGTPRCFDYLGDIERDSAGRWLARPEIGEPITNLASQGEAVSALIERSAL